MWTALLLVMWKHCGWSQSLECCSMHTQAFSQIREGLSPYTVESEMIKAMTQCKAGLKRQPRYSARALPAIRVARMSSTCTLARRVPPATLNSPSAPALSPPAPELQMTEGRDGVDLIRRGVAILEAAYAAAAHAAAAAAAVGGGENGLAGERDDAKVAAGEGSRGPQAESRDRGGVDRSRSGVGGTRGGEEKTTISPRLVRARVCEKGAAGAPVDAGRHRV